MVLALGLGVGGGGERGGWKGGGELERSGGKVALGFGLGVVEGG